VESMRSSASSKWPAANQPATTGARSTKARCDEVDYSRPTQIWRP
jgi:hypothetical protein